MGTDGDGGLKPPSPSTDLWYNLKKKRGILYNGVRKYANAGRGALCVRSIFS